MPLPSLTGESFLPCALALVGLATLAAGQISLRLRPRGREAGSLDADALAMLAGGLRRYADAIIADLHESGALLAQGDGRWQPVPTFQVVNPAARALLAAHRPFAQADAQITLALHASRIAADLRRKGLLLEPDQQARLRLAMVLPYVVGLLACLYAQRVGLLTEVPRGQVIAMVLVTLASAGLRYVRCDARTQAGIAAVTQAQVGHIHARGASAHSAQMTVALFGSAALAQAPHPGPAQRATAHRPITPRLPHRLVARSRPRA